MSATDTAVLVEVPESPIHKAEICLTIADLAEIRDNRSLLYNYSKPNARHVSEYQFQLQDITSQIHFDYYIRKAQRGSDILQNALRVAYPDRIPRIPETLGGQRLEPLVTRPERTGSVTLYDGYPNEKFNGLSWLVDEIGESVFQEEVWAPLRKWVKSQKRNNTDQNLIDDMRYARNKIKYVPRRSGQKFDKEHKYAVYDEDGESGGTARPASIHRQNRPYGARVDWVRVNGELQPTIAYPTNSAEVCSRHRDALALVKAKFGSYIYDERKVPLPVRLVRIPDAGAGKGLFWRFNREFWWLRSKSERPSPHRDLQRQFDSMGKPLYFPVFINRDSNWRSTPLKDRFLVIDDQFLIIDAVDVDEISSSELKELQHIWEDRLREGGLGNPEVREFPFRTLLRTTEEPQDPLAEVERITDGIRLRQELNSLSREQKEFANDIMAKIMGGQPLDQNERQRKHRLLNQLLTIDEVWYKAEERLSPDERVNGLYALVVIPQQAPRLRFLLDEQSALATVKQVVAAHLAEQREHARQFSKTPYALVKIEQAREALARTIRSKVGQEALLSASLRILTF